MLPRVIKNMRLGTALSVGLVLGVLGPAVVTGWLTINEKKAIALEQLNDNHQQLVDILCLGLQRPIWDMVPKNGESLVDAVMTEERVTSILVITDDGLFLKRRKEEIANGESYSITNPVMLLGEETGQVTVEVNGSSMDAALLSQTHNYLLTSLMQIISSLLIIYLLLSRKMLKPIKRLLSQSKNIARKATQYRIQVGPY